jgi:membrane-associated phospholipid phosphatase
MLQFAARYGDDVLSPANPYRGSRTQFGDITFGAKDILTLVAEAALAAQKAAYFQKWVVHRRLRPEVFAGRVEMHIAGRKSYDIHPSLLDSDGLERSAAAIGNRLLPVAYPEGCPTHPSYPAAHAYNAGACAAVLKAFFNQEFPLPAPMQANDDGSALEPWRGAPLTLGQEIDKLASNIAIGRNAAGVHYRSDSINGLVAGEAVGIALLADRSALYHEQFNACPMKHSLIEPGVGIRLTFMRVVGAFLAAEVTFAVAPTRRRLIGTVLGAQALQRGPGLDQRAADGEMLVGQEPLDLRVSQHGLQELRRDIGFEQALAVLGKGRVIPYRIVDAGPDEPAKQEIVVDLLHQLTLRAHRIERLRNEALSSRSGAIDSRPRTS